MTVRRTTMLALAGATLGLSLALSAAVASPNLTLLSALPLVGPREACADRLARAGQPAASAAESRAALDASPAAASAWLRLAWLDSQGSAGLTPRARDAIERSYAVAPLGPDVSPWRLAFLLDRWRDLPPALRSQALAEMRAMQGRQPEAFHIIATSVHDPAGRLAAAMADKSPHNSVADKARRTPAFGKPSPSEIS